jgi:hypothetical protein
VLLVAFMAGAAVAQTQAAPEASPQWEIRAERTPDGVLHCDYYEPGTMTREEPLTWPAESITSAHEVGKWAFNEEYRAPGEPVVREQALRPITLFAAPTPLAGAEKWDFSMGPEVGQAAVSVPPEGAGRGGGTIPTERPPAYRSDAQREVKDFSHFEGEGPCQTVRPDVPSALDQVNNRQFAPQWHF